MGIRKRKENLTSLSEGNNEFDKITAMNTVVNTAMNSVVNSVIKTLENGKHESKSASDETRQQLSEIITDLGIDLESIKMTQGGVMRRDAEISHEERKYLYAVERGDIASVKNYIENANNFGININCLDSFGRSAIIIAIDIEHIELLEILLNLGLEIRDALLHAIEEENIYAVELLLQYQDSMKGKKKTKDLSGMLGDAPSSSFTSDITPIILAAHMDNYEILKLLLDRGERVIKPHDPRCACQECCRAQKENSLKHSKARLNTFKALSSPSLICLSSNDPILTAFEISWELRRLGHLEVEFFEDYMTLSKQATLFATSLLEQTRSSEELACVLNHDVGNTNANKMKGIHEEENDDDNHMELARLKMAIKYNQKEFVAHAHCQQLLATLWYDGLPGFRKKSLLYQIAMCLTIAGLFPALSGMYMMMPRSKIGKFIKHPFVKFLCHSASYLFFLLLLFLSAIRFEYWVLGTLIYHMNERGAIPTIVECAIIVYVIGFVWAEIKELWSSGVKAYISDIWNLLDFVTNSLYIATITLRCIAFYKVYQNPSLKYIEREMWDSYDPTLISEALFATANIFSMLKLIYVFTVNPRLGPLQISLGRIINDIINMFFVYILLMSAFACGFYQLYWVYALKRYDFCKEVIFRFNDTGSELEKYTYCTTRGRYFTDLFQIVQTLYFAAYGLVDLTNLNLEMQHSVTEFVGKLMYGAFCLITIIVIISMLIAMMSNSYQRIYESQDTEWKFARSSLWISFFEVGGTVPAPFNIFPTMKSIRYIFVWMKNKIFGCTKEFKDNKWQSIKKVVKSVSDKEQRYQQVIRDLIQRYLIKRQRDEENKGITEDDLAEIKGDISAFRFELLEILSTNGMKLSEHITQNSNRVVGKLRHRGSKRVNNRVGRLSEQMNGTKPNIAATESSSNVGVPVSERLTRLQHNSENSLNSENSDSESASDSRVFTGMINNSIDELDENVINSEESEAISTKSMDVTVEVEPDTMMEAQLMKVQRSDEL